MKTEIALTEPVAFEENATLSPPAGVTLAALEKDIAQAPATSLENLQSIASKISNLRPTVKSPKGANKRRKAKATTRAPKRRSEKGTGQKIYDRVSRAFD